MQYQKPEIVLLGQATELILGHKTNHLLDGHGFGIPINDSELDD